MKVNKEIIKKDGYINFNVKGIIDNLNFNKELIEVFYKIDNSTLKYNCKKVLLDVIDLDYDITDFDRYKIGEMIASSYKKNFIRIACL